MADQIVQRLRQTTDLDILDIENIIGLGGDQVATQRIALHQLIQTRRLADAAERQAAALERFLEGALGYSAADGEHYVRVRRTARDTP